jgi:protein-S-isoprenylcysteine O-methyltransferase Ste14
MKKTSSRYLAGSLAAHGSILVFALMGLEVIIMISPFAFFFYSVFSPIFNFLNHYPATAWLTTFFLPHMILPPTLGLRVIRIAGSVLFLAGALTFLICALQVYLGKIFKWGLARHGLYRFIRHPQYLALAMWGIGMAILWPRFIVLVFLSIMFVLYYYLSRDEERRMLARYPESYSAYMASTGMFFPRIKAQRSAVQPGHLLSSPWRHAVIPILTVAVVLSTGFLLREVTLKSLPFETEGNLSMISILPEDNPLVGTIVQAIAANKTDTTLAFLKSEKDYLGYVMPPDYVMQGMIANTGSDFHLFKQHNTVAMISDWVLHPFEHLRRSPAAHMAKMHNVEPTVARRHHCPLGKNDASLDCSICPYRRVILVEVDGNGGQRLTGSATLSISAPRIPVGFVDINAATGEIIESQRVGTATAWAGIPTPAI